MLLLTFVVVAFVFWEAKFSILRYIVALEALTGVVLLAVASALGWIGHRRFLPGFVVLTVLVVALSEKQNWGRLRQYGAQAIEVDAPALPDRAVVATANKPMAFVLPFLRGHDPVFVGLVDVSPGTRQWDETLRLLGSGRPIRVLLDPTQPSTAADLGSFALMVDHAACQPVRTNLRAGLLLCPARLGARPG